MTDEQNKNNENIIEKMEAVGALNECQNELKQIKDRYTFLMADFENYKKRTAKENERLVLNAQTTVILKFLPIIDNLNRFFESAKNNPSNDIKSWLDGISLLNKELSKILLSLDIQEVQVTTFDPEVHEAISQVKVEGKEPGTIVDVLEKGYTYKNVLIRPAKVTVVK